jgi:long-chain-fatty-acid--CoA ligase
MSRIALIGKSSVNYISLLIDIWNNGDCAVLIDWQTPFYTAVEMMREAGVRLCYLQDDLWSTYMLDDHSEIEIIRFSVDNETTFVLPDRIYDKFDSNYSRSEAVVIYSSGTTGKSKGIILSHFAINTNADAIIDYMHPSASDDCMYTVKPLSHSSTLTGELLVALKIRTKLIITSSAVPSRYILTAIKQYCVSILCLNPTLLSFLCDEAGRKNYDISSLEKIYVSGAILNDKIYEKAKRVLKGISVFNAYGLSEASPRVTAQTSECCKSNSVGKPINGVEVAIVDENGMLIADEMRGIIHVKTPSLFSGYVTGSEKHRSLYRGWLNTGDIGFVDKFGEIHVVGRIDDVIICDAHKVYPSDVEKLIMEDQSVFDCAVSKCIVNGAEVIGCLYVSGKDCSMDIVHRLRNTLMQYEIPKKYLRVEIIPRNSRGKVNRKDVSDILSEKSLKG